MHRQEKQHAKSALLSIVLIACSCIVLSAVLVTSGRGGDDVISLFVSTSLQLLKHTIKLFLEYVSFLENRVVSLHILT